MAVNTPDGGGGGSSTPPFTDITVVPEDLARFADLLDGDLKAIKDTWERLKSDLASRPSPNFPGAYAEGIGYASGYPEVVHGGSDGIYEGREFNRAYHKTMFAKWQLMEHVIKGLETLRDAARMIHDDYLASDAANAEGLETAFDAYERSAVIEALGEPDQQTEPGTPT